MMTSESKRPLFMAVMDAVRGLKLTPADKLVLGYLAVRQGRNRECWPGIHAIATDLSLAIQTVLDSTERLHAAGMVRKTPGCRGRGHSHRYAVSLAKNSTEQTFFADEKTPESSDFKPEKRSTPRKENVYSSEMNHSRSIHEEENTPSALPTTKRKAKGRAAPTFTPPTVEEVLAYAEDRGDAQFDAARFVTWYTERNWTDSNGKPVHD